MCYHIQSRTYHPKVMESPWKEKQTSVRNDINETKRNSNCSDYIQILLSCPLDKNHSSTRKSQVKICQQKWGSIPSSLLGTGYWQFMRSQSSLFRRYTIPFQAGLYFTNANLNNPYYIQQRDNYNDTSIPLYFESLQFHIRPSNLTNMW